MMNTPCSLIWTAAGCPIMAGDTAGQCRTCGADGVGLPFDQWVKDTFTDHNRLGPGTIVCHACLFCFDESSMLCAQRVGKDKPQRMRNYSHFVVDGVWTPLSKGNKRDMRTLLFAAPSVAVIADSGQKHIIFKARVGWWSFEEQPIYPCPERLQYLLDPIEQLYNAGANKHEIETGHYSQKTLLKILPLWRALDPLLQPYRGGLPLQLAMFLAQKDASDDICDT